MFISLLNDNALYNQTFYLSEEQPIVDQIVNSDMYNKLHKNYTKLNVIFYIFTYVHAFVLDLSFQNR